MNNMISKTLDVLKNVFNETFYSRSDLALIMGKILAELNEVIEDRDLLRKCQLIIAKAFMDDIPGSDDNRGKDVENDSK